MVAKRPQKPIAESALVLAVRPGETAIVETVEEPVPGVVVVTESVVSLQEDDDEEDR